MRMTIVIFALSGCLRGAAVPSEGLPIDPTADTADPIAPADPLPEPTDVTLEYGTRTFNLRWTASPAASIYTVSERLNPDDTFELLASVPSNEPLEYDHVAPLFPRAQLQFLLEACNDVGCVGTTVDPDPGLIPAIGFFNASNAQPGDQFGSGAAISADGTTIAIAAAGEASAFTNDPTDNSLERAGAVYVYRRQMGETWAQEAYVKARQPVSKALQGPIALSADGNTMVVGSPQSDGNATGVNGVPTNSLRNTGGAYVFTWTQEGWLQAATLHPTTPVAFGGAGQALSISANGQLIALGAPADPSAAEGVNGPRDNSDAPGSGAVFLFESRGTEWGEAGYIKASNPEMWDAFGRAVALSGDGRTLVVGAPLEDSAMPDQKGDNESPSAGAVYVYQGGVGAWEAPLYLKAPMPSDGVLFGAAVAVSANGSTVAVSAPSIRGQSNTALIYVFERDGTRYTLDATLKPVADDAADSLQFGFGVDMNGAGNLLVVSAQGETGGGKGVLQPTAGDGSAPNAGAAFVYGKTNREWALVSKLKSLTTTSDQGFGSQVSISNNAHILVGAPGPSEGEGTAFLY